MRKRPKLSDMITDRNECYKVTLVDAIGNITMQQMREDLQPDLRCIPIKIKDFDVTAIEGWNHFELKESL